MKNATVKVAFFISQREGKQRCL